MDTEEVVEEINPIDIMFSDASDDVGDDVVVRDEVSEQVEDEVEQAEEVEEQEEVEEEEVEVEEEEEVDYDAPAKKKEETQEEEEVIPESKAVERAKIEGKRRKELELEKKEWELEKDRIQKERDEFESRLKEFESTKIKPTEHPDFISMRDEILQEAKDEVDDLDAPNAQVLYTGLGEFITQYRKIDGAEKRDEALATFKDHLASKLFDDVESLDDLDKEDRRVVSSALRMLKKSASKADNLEKLRDSLEEKARAGTLAVGVKEYERTASEFAPIFDAIGDLDDEIIEANPYAIESVVARIGKEDKKRLDGAKKDVLEIMNGLRPLTQDELEKLSSNGTDLKAFQAQRQKAHVEKKKKLAAFFVQGLVSRATFKQMAEELAELKSKKASEESEEDALRRVAKKKAPVKDVKKVKSPVDIMFED